VHGAKGKKVRSEKLKAKALKAQNHMSSRLKAESSKGSLRLLEERFA
jgi:hypothetical protein